MTHGTSSLPPSNAIHPSLACQSVACAGCMRMCAEHNFALPLYVCVIVFSFTASESTDNLSSLEPEPLQYDIYIIQGMECATEIC